MTAGSNPVLTTNRKNMKNKRMLIKVDLSGCKNMKEACRVVDYLRDDKIKLSVEKIKK